MRILFVVDGRSPTALRWMEYFIPRHEVHLVSSFPCEPPPGLASFEIIPVAFSGAVAKDSAGGRGLRAALPAAWRARLRNWLAPLTLGKAAGQLSAHIQRIQPDLVHAMRIPYEGILAARVASSPLLVSVWGNDFTLHAGSSPLLAAATRQTLAAADALHSDTHTDQARAQSWGFSLEKPWLVLPGNGGVRADVFYPAAQPPQILRVVNPRGIRAYLRNDSFFQAIPQVLAVLPDVHFDCPGMQGEAEAERWVQRLGLEARVHLLPQLSAAQLAETYRAAQLMASPSTHDGTPNSLLEAMASGLLPVCGDLPSIREWIEPGRNGLLVDPGDADALAAAMLRGLKDDQLRQQAAEINQELVAERADYETNMLRVIAFYEEISGVHA